MAITISGKTRIKTTRLTCPKHIMYNPEKDFEGGIKGGCACCGSIYQAWRASDRFEITIRSAEDDLFAAIKEAENQVRESSREKAAA